MMVGTIFLVAMVCLFSASLGVALSPSRRQYTRLRYALTGLGMIFALLAVLVNVGLESRYVTYEVFLGGLGALYGAVQLWVIHLDGRIDKIFELLAA
ncbi:MAG: hypothetical protein AOA65_1731 [Candidatus Bathyarchaeota archaeon BA1]|nr:MAG: hypothetical protein AOA65_1731 [Candidatus Bathyarchaeota archaeon BA1]